MRGFFVLVYFPYMKEAPSNAEHKADSSFVLTAEDPSVHTPIWVCADLDLPEGKHNDNGEDWKVIEEAGYTPEQVVNVEFGAHPNRLIPQNMKFLTGYAETSQEGYAVSVISAVDERPKQSGVNVHNERYRECVGVIASGTRRSDGVRISFMSHSPPPLFMRKDYRPEAFEQQMRESMESLKVDCDPGSIDIAIIGGRPSHVGDVDYLDKVPDTYEKAVQFLATLSMKIFDIRPLVVSVPEVYGNRIEAFFDTSKNRLHVRVVGSPHSVLKAAGTYSVARYDESLHRIGNLV